MENLDSNLLAKLENFLKKMKYGKKVVDRREILI